MAERIDKPGLSFWDDELLHVWECPRVLRLPGGNPDYIRCGYLGTGPGTCPYDHPEPVELVEITAVVLCSGCGAQIMRRDSRTEDGRLICGECVFQEIGSARAATRDQQQTGDQP